MKQAPQIYIADQLRKWDVDCQISPGMWVACRPMSPSFYGVADRLRLAWLVFTGECDALKWRGQ